MTVNRRNFIKNGALLTAFTCLPRFENWKETLRPTNTPLHNIPVEKQIDPNWLNALYKKNGPTTYRKSKNELDYIGMPVGGLHAGTVYLGGDGRLWLWQIYNESIEGEHEGVVPETVVWNDGTADRKIRPRDGASYVSPSRSANRRVLEQGIALKIVRNGQTIIRELSSEDWKEISFEATYPIGTVQYLDLELKLDVVLQAYSPFVPLDAENSALPVTILNLKVKNLATVKTEVSILGWMENGVCKLSGKADGGRKRASVFKKENLTAINFDFEVKNNATNGAKDYGTMCFALHRSDAWHQLPLDPWPIKSTQFIGEKENGASVAGDQKLVAGLGVTKLLKSGESLDETFSISWHFNHANEKLSKTIKEARSGYLYGKRFASARDVTVHLSENFSKLTGDTLNWQKTWFDSTLPEWFLERTFMTICTLATANTYRFADGRFWGWEGVGACAGTCTHVWQYAQAMGRLFPEIERDQRQRVDLGIGFQENSGAIIFRAENETRPAIDGQAGTILRIYREHLMAASDGFLKSNWNQIRKAVEFMLAQDKNGDGLTDTPMENTLDAVWDGEISWITGLCVAAARAAQEMAEEVNDKHFASICNKYVLDGTRNMEAHLFNGEYFVHRPDTKMGRKKLGSYDTCHIDQVYGQSWAFQVGLPRILSKEKTLSALKSLWKYNFTMDVGPYIKTHEGGRPYALAGEGGMIMNTNPKNQPQAYGEDVTWQIGYFHECMTGFEHQVASHLMAEGMTDEALTLTRVIHERYHGAKRNPYNEIECSDHYARAMASYGTFISACGYHYHGPKGSIRFDPKIQQNQFRAPFTVAEGWGSYTQKINGRQKNYRVSLKYGQLRLRELVVRTNGAGGLFKVTAKNETIPTERFDHDGLATFRFKEELFLRAGEALQLQLT